MHLFPCELKHEVEFDYAIIDLNANAEYFEQLQNNLISLVPSFAQNIKTSFPYLLRLSSVDDKLIHEINKYNDEQISLGQLPFFLFKFKSKPVREPDIVNFLKKKIIYDVNGRKFLYRFYDPRVWVLMNFLNFSDFSFINKYFTYVEIPVSKSSIIFMNNMEEISEVNDFNSIDAENRIKLIDRVTVCNRVLNILEFYSHDFSIFLDKIHSIFNNIKELDEFGVSNIKDLVAATFHLEILGKELIEDNLFVHALESESGYDNQSKNISINDWDKLFDKLGVVDKDIQNKVIYGY